jgi:hypothetical protein
LIPKGFPAFKRYQKELFGLNYPSVQKRGKESCDTLLLKRRPSVTVKKESIVVFNTTHP